MSVKSFKFVSPGVFINEIDNSAIPKSAQAIGPVVIGRATRGLAMQPVSVESYSDFVQMYGDTVPGFGGGDISRDGNQQSPMYGTYTAKAFLNANVAPLTYVRLLGQQSTDAVISGRAGWRTTKLPGSHLAENGGAYGLFLFASGSSVDLGQGYLGATFYVDASASVYLSGTLHGPGSTALGEGVGRVVGQNSVNGKNVFTVKLTSSAGTYNDKINFDFNDANDTYIRERFNTNPQLANALGAFYPSHAPYWLGESYGQFLRDKEISPDKDLLGVILPIGLNTDAATTPALVQQSSREAVAGWFIGQDLGDPASFIARNAQKLFRLTGRGHGEWLNKNAKISIDNLRAPTSNSTSYGTFSILIRKLTDTDNNVEILERFDNCTLDPSSPDFVGRKLGDTYYIWNSTERRLRKYGEYPNQSKFVYIEIDSDVEAGATDPALLPFGYFGPPNIKSIQNAGGTLKETWGDAGLNSTFVYTPAGGVSGYDTNSILFGDAVNCTGTLNFPETLVRANATDGGLSDPTDAYFGFRVTRTAASTIPDQSVKDLGRLLYSGFSGDPTRDNITGINSWDRIFTMNDLSASVTGQGFVYVTDARKDLLSAGSWSYIISQGYDRFTAPFWGGFDGFDIKKPDPMYNEGLTNGTDTTNYGYNTWKQAIDIVADPEFVNMNMLLSPGLTNDSLTGHMISVCEDRADSLAIIDLPSVYTPPHEAYKSDKQQRVGSGARTTATALKNRSIDSSYGCTFYPWVQTRDANTGQLVWIPPSVAMAGVLASSQAKSDVWFAPAGFNRGGLTDGAAGIPITNVTERVISKDRDILYESRINPIASFPSTGIVVFGQKTLQARQSALDRINVRRLVIYLKKQISILASQILFEQNVQATWNRFRSLVEPFLANVKVQFGITDYRLILDESTTTPDLIDQNIMYAKIMVKPARAIEYIAIDFVVTSTGASFDD